jgi:hypothetical protein
MIRLIDKRDCCSVTADFWLYAGDVVIMTITVFPPDGLDREPRHKGKAVEVSAVLPMMPRNGAQDNFDTGWVAQRYLGIPTAAVWLAKMGVDPQPIITLAAERGWGNEVIAEANAIVEKEKARAVPPVDYLVIFLQGGIAGHHVYLPFCQVVAAIQGHCDTELQWQPKNGDFISLSDGEGYKDALAYPLYPPYDYIEPASVSAPADDTIPVEIRVDIKDRADCGGFAPPETPGEWLAWILDEARLQAEQADAAQDNEERQARLKYVAQLKATANRMIKDGVEPDKLPWQKTTLKLSERWIDGLREGVERVNANIEIDTYGISVTVSKEPHGEDPCEVLVEFYDGVVKAHIWRAEDYGGDPVESIELFKTSTQDAETLAAYMGMVRDEINVTSYMHVVNEENGVLTVALDVANEEGTRLYETEVSLRLEGDNLVLAGVNDTHFGQYPVSTYGPQQVVTLLEELQLGLRSLPCL